VTKESDVKHSKIANKIPIINSNLPKTLQDKRVSIPWKGR